MTVFSIMWFDPVNLPVKSCGVQGLCLLASHSTQHNSGGAESCKAQKKMNKK